MEVKKAFEKAGCVAKAIGRGLVKGLDEGLNKIEEIRKESEENSKRYSSKIVEEETVITSDMAKQLRWMSSSQLQAIFSGKKVRVDRDPETWKQLRWMGAEQLNAIFGKGGAK